MLRIRRELGDDAKEQRMLRTIPRFGYRWVAPLGIEDSAAGAGRQSAAPQVALTGSPATARSATKPLIAALLAVAVLAAALGIFRHRDASSPPAPMAIGQRGVAGSNRARH